MAMTTTKKKITIPHRVCAYTRMKHYADWNKRQRKKAFAAAKLLVISSFFSSFNMLVKAQARSSCVYVLAACAVL